MIYVFWGVDMKALGTSLHAFSMFSVLLMLFVALLSMLPMAMRLMFLSGKKLRFLKSVQAIFIGQGMNNILPAKLGEIVKVFYIHSATGLRRSRGLELVFWERFSDLNVLLIMAGSVLWATGRNDYIIPLVVVVAGTWIVLGVLRWCPDFSKRLIRLIPWQRVQDSAQVFHVEIACRFEPRFFVHLAIYSTAFWVIAASLTGIAFGAAGLYLTMPQWLAVFVVSSLGLALPGAPGGLGVYEASVIISSMWFGVDKESALALAIVLRAVQYIPVTLLGVVALHFSELTLKGLLQKRVAE